MRELRVVARVANVIKLESPHTWDQEEVVELIGIGFFDAIDAPSPSELRLGSSRGMTTLSDLTTARIGHARRQGGADIFLTEQEEAEHAARKIVHQARPHGKSESADERLERLRRMSRPELEDVLMRALAGVE